jgi:hypothetical protein
MKLIFVASPWMISARSRLSLISRQRCSSFLDHADVEAALFERLGKEQARHAAAGDHDVLDALVGA